MIGEPALISGVAKEPSMFACPCCGAQTETPVSIEDLRELQSGFLKRGVLEALINAKGRGVSTESIAHQVYQLKDDYPDWTDTNIRVTIYRARKELKKYGWTINKIGGSQVALYKLTPLETRVGALGTA